MTVFKNVDTWVFDLDNTLYDADTGLMSRISDRMTLFISELLGVSYEEAGRIRQAYWEKHGVTLRGLMVEHQVDPHKFLAHAHDFDVSDIPRCDVIRQGLKGLPGRKVIFTNAPRHFALRMTDHLGIAEHFDGIFSIEDTEFLPKPQPSAYKTFVDKQGVDPARACMLDDMEINLKPAADLGMKTVWLHGRDNTHAGAEFPHVTSRAIKLADWLKARHV